MGKRIIELVTKSDVRRIWEIRNHPLARKNSLDQREISFERHKTWFAKKYFGNENNYCFVLKDNARVIGYCRFDLDENGNYRTSIAIDPEFWGQGLGALLLRESLNRLGVDSKVLAEIRRDNEASIKIFAKNGFVKISEDEENFYFERKISKNQCRFPLPEVLRIEPAASCNFRCNHCPTGLGLSPKGIMTMKTFDKIIERVSKLELRVIVLYHGGEPLLNKNLFAMIEKLRPLAPFIKTVTNGSLLNDKTIDQFLKSGIDHVEISMDGTSPEENDRIRTGANFQKISANVIKLVKQRVARGVSKPQVCISNVQIPDNLAPKDLPSVPDYLKAAFAEVAEQIEYKLTWACIWPDLPRINPDPPDLPDGNFCDNIVSTITIRCNGDVVPCCYDLTSQMVMGNILEEELETIWNGQHYLDLRRNIRGYTPPALCRNCLVIFTKKRMTQDYLDKIIANQRTD